jgi:hypothetical protein
MLKLKKYGRGTNGHLLEAGDLTIWFSYETPIALHIRGKGGIIRPNAWGPTTGQHMNAARAEAGVLQDVTSTEFEDALKTMNFWFGLSSAMCQVGGEEPERG